MMIPRRGRSWLISLAVAGSLGACSAHERGATRRVLTIGQAEAVLWPGQIQTAYEAPTEEQRRALHDLITRLWRGAPPEAAAEVVALARRAGMAVELWTIHDLVAWVIREPEPVRGYGIYIIRASLPGPARPILLQAPHVYYDLQTQRVAAAMFWLTDAPAIRGLFTNSQHRFQQAPRVRERRAFNPADVAHNVDHPFQTATDAVAAAGPVVVIQLHGFEGAARDEAASAIVSSGRREGSTIESTAVAAQLTEVLGVRVARFPEDTSALGGTTNVQGRLISTVPSARFVHIELTAALRDRLRDHALAAQLASAVVGALDGASAR